jgi:hypothetical protein
MELPESFKSPNNWTTTPNALRHLYDFINGITEEEEEILLAIEVDLFTIGIVYLPEIELVSVEINSLEFNFEESKFDFQHVPSNILVDDTPTHFNDKDWEIAQWNLLEEAQVRNLNLGTQIEPKIVKINNNLDLMIVIQTKQLLKEYHDVFAWSYKDFKGIPPHIVQH